MIANQRINLIAFFENKTSKKFQYTYIFNKLNCKKLYFDLKRKIIKIMKPINMLQNF